MQKLKDRQEVSVFIINLSDFYTEITRYASTLSLDEMSRANRFVFDIHKNRFIVARGLLRQLLGRYLEITPKEVSFDYNPYGKPNLSKSLYQSSQLEFNLSHSENWAAFAFSLQDPIGIDIEAMKEKLEFDEIATRFFSVSESTKLAQLPIGEKKNAFFNAWTRKEALLKALGQGLSFPLKNCEVTMLDHEEAKIISVAGSPLEASQFSIYSFIPTPNYKGAIVSYQSGKRFTITPLSEGA